MDKFTNDDYKKMDEAAWSLEQKHIIGSAKGIEESKEILAFTSFYRMQRAMADKSNENSGLNIPCVIGSSDAEYTEKEVINFAKYVWYRKSLKDTKRGLLHYFKEWLDMGKNYCP